MKETIVNENFTFMKHSKVQAYTRKVFKLRSIDIDKDTGYDFHTPTPVII